MPLPADRSAILEARRTLKMARSAHAYVRGNTAKFYEWLAASKAARRVPQGPAIWICGDCHLGNLGPVADGRGSVEIQIRDLDQAVIGNPAHDLIRLGLSLATAARGSDLPGVVTMRMMEAMVEGYAAAIGGPDHDDPDLDSEIVRSVEREALGRRWRHLAKERLDAVEPRIPLGKKFWELSPEEREALTLLFVDERVGAMVLSLKGKPQDREVRLVDAAYWMKGCSSLGLLRYAAIVALRTRKGNWSYALVDLKEATAPIAPAASGAEMPGDPAERVVTAARHMSPYLGERMMPVTMLDRSLFMRELTPHDMKLEVEQFSQGEAVRAARHLAFVVGTAHARQLDMAARSDWLAMIEADRNGALDTPSWLWESVVMLSGSHEAGYLEHCRRYAIAA